MSMRDKQILSRTHICVFGRITLLTMSMMSIALRNLSMRILPNKPYSLLLKDIMQLF